MDATCRREAVLPPENETTDIKEIEAFLVAQATDEQAHLVGPHGERLLLPDSVYTLLKRAVHELARGNAVTIVPIQAELTTQQAADLLNVSRPFLIKLLEAGQMPYHMVGTHRRVTYRDLIAYRDRRDQVRREALRDMAREAQEMGTCE